MEKNRKTKEIVICGLLAAGIFLAISGNGKADFKYGTPKNLGSTVNSSFWDNDPIVSADGLSLFFDSDRPGGYGGFDVWVTTRETVQDSWGQPVNLGPKINTSANEASGGVSPDGLEFYFSSNRPGGSGYDIWVTTRATVQDPWGNPVNLGSTINGSASDLGGVISADGLEFYFNSNRPGGSGGYDLWVTTRATIQDTWGDPVNLGSMVNSPDWDYSPAPSPDGLKLFFSSDRPGEYGDWSIWVTERETRDGDWGAPVNLGPAVNSWTDQENPYISVDGSTLYFGSTRPGSSGNVDLWQVPILPIVDFNADGIVDAEDMCVIVDHWGKNYPICDIGPTPWGDGIVDIQDLIVFSEHLFEEVQDSTLIAHWALDETEGMFAADSIGDNDAFVVGGATWQPDIGQVDGALELDGVSGCAILNPVLNPADTSLSIFAWVKGNMPGTTIVSQQAIANWLATDINGNLMTELKSSDTYAGPLHSQTVITDGQWHIVGLVWDGLHRMLCIDGVVVAEDMQPGLEDSQMGLYIGVDKNYAPGTFWSGLIDEICIYNRAVSP